MATAYGTRLVNALRETPIGANLLRAPEANALVALLEVMQGPSEFEPADTDSTDNWHQMTRATNGTAVTDSATPVADTTMKFTPAAGTVEVEYYLRVEYGIDTDAGGYKVGISGTITNPVTTIGISTALQSGLVADLDVEGEDDDTLVAYLRGSFMFDTTAEEHAITLAQFTAADVDVRFLAKSFVRWRQVA